MTDYTKFQDVYDQINSMGEIPIATTQEEWLAAYKQLIDCQTALSIMLRGDKDSDVRNLY